MDKELATLLVESSSYRDFLKRFFSEEVCHHKVSYASFARRAGFASRNFPRDVQVGSKRITHRSLPKFVKGFGLRGDLAQYFRLLVENEETDLGGEDTASTQLKLDRLKQKIQNRLNQPVGAGSASLYLFAQWPKVYAALGDSQRGAQLSQIIQRTGFSQTQCQRILDHMVEKGFVGKNQQGNYLAKSSHLVLEGMGKDDAFKVFFRQALREVERKSQTHFGGDQALFYHGVFSVNRQRLPELKKEMLELLHRFVDENEDCEGDSATTMVCSMF